MKLVQVFRSFFQVFGRSFAVFSVPALLVFFGAQAGAQSADYLPSPDCYSKDVLTRYSKQYRGLDFQSRDRLCRKDQPVQFRVIEALEFLRGVQFDRANQSSGDELVTPLLPDSWPTFFSAQVKQFSFEKSCAQGVLAYVDMTPPVQPIMHVCTEFGVPSNNVAYLASALLHESWHVRSKIAHVKCTSGLGAGVTKACDESVSVHGAYAISLESLARIAAAAKNVGYIGRDAARNNMLAIAFQNFNTLPKIRRGVVPLLITTDKVLRLDTPKNFAGIRKAPLGIVTSTRDGDLMIFGTVGSSELVHTSSTGNFDFQDKVPDSIATAYSQMAGDQRSAIRGVHYGKNISALMQEKMLTVYCRKEGTPYSDLGRRSRFEVKSTSFTSIVYPAGYSYGSPTFTVQNNNGQWAEISCDGTGDSQLSSWRNSGYNSAKKVMLLGGNTYVLGENGELYREKNDNGKTTFVNETNGKLKVFDLFQRGWIQYIDGE